MAEPGDPDHDADHDHDADIGFVSPASLAGRRREVEPEPASEPEIVPDREPEPQPEPELNFEPSVREVEPVLAPAAPPRASTFDLSPDRRRDRDTQTSPQPEKAMSLYAVYALILFAVPTMGVSALIGLLAVTGREPPASGIGRGHFIYQQRTLLSAAVIALLGAILIVVNIGVFVLFVLALWIMARGAFGVLRLQAGRPIDKPLNWLI